MGAAAKVRNLLHLRRPLRPPKPDVKITASQETGLTILTVCIQSEDYEVIRRAITTAGGEIMGKALKFEGRSIGDIIGESLAKICKEWEEWRECMPKW